MIVLGLGSNNGNRLSYFRKAIQMLRSPRLSPSLEVVAVSPIYESEALLPEGAPADWNRNYLNLNVLCKSSASPNDVLRHIKSIESALGRKDRGRWAPREIDIDILLFGSENFESEGLRIPHPSLMDRPFVMLPLADIYPQWTVPIQGPFQGLTISEVVSPWRRKSKDQVPYQTHKTALHLTELVGIVNITPDSFSDGGSSFQEEDAIKKSENLIAHGVSVLDLGAESTRPGSLGIDPKVEWKRIEPVLKNLKSLQSPSLPQSVDEAGSVLLSLDTRNAETAKKAIQLGINWINDVTGFDDLEMRKIVADSDVNLVVMHSLTVPHSRNVVLSNNGDPTDLILSWGEKRITELCKLGVSRERIIFDPGIGYGKTIEQTWELLRSMRRFQNLGVRILVGHSRKSFLTLVTDKPAPERDIETLILSVEMASQGVNFLRIHQAEFHKRALKTWSQVNGVVR